MLAIWDLNNRRMDCCTQLSIGGADAIALSPNGKFIALGFLNGALMVLDANTYAAVAKR